MTSKLKPARPAPQPAPIQQLHHYAYRAKMPRRPATSTKTSWACRCTTLSRATMCPATGEYCPYTHFFFRLQDAPSSPSLTWATTGRRAFTQHPAVGESHLPSGLTHWKSWRP